MLQKALEIQTQDEGKKTVLGWIREGDAVDSGAGDSGAAQYWWCLAVSYTKYLRLSNTQEDRPKGRLAWTMRRDLTLID